MIMLDRKCISTDMKGGLFWYDDSNLVKRDAYSWYERPYYCYSEVGCALKSWLSLQRRVSLLVINMKGSKHLSRHSHEAYDAIKAAEAWSWK